MGSPILLFQYVWENPPEYKGLNLWDKQSNIWPEPSLILKFVYMQAVKASARLQFSAVYIWPLTQENLSLGFANNKSAGQPAHPRSLISTFIIHLLLLIISRLGMSEISIF